MAELADRTIGFSLGELKLIKHKILLALGKEKLSGILGALKGDLVDVLIVGMDTANAFWISGGYKLARFAHNDSIRRTKIMAAKSTMILSEPQVLQDAGSASRSPINLSQPPPTRSLKPFCRFSKGLMV